MQAWTMQRGRPVAPLFNILSAMPCHGMLLALDGRHLDRAALPLASQVCRPVGKRLDILLVNPPKPATLLLWPLLQELEREGIDYRLTSCEGELADELTHYVHRFRHISCILLDRLDTRLAGLHPALQALRREGYEVLTLRDEEPMWAHTGGRIGGFALMHSTTTDACPIWKAAGAFPRLGVMEEGRQVSRSHPPVLDDVPLRSNRTPSVSLKTFIRHLRQQPLLS